MATKIYRVHPGIGIARLGNSMTEHFIGPESPGLVPLPRGPYRDSDGFLKRQGARFRVYEYEYDDSGRLIDVGEITAHSAKIKWSVHLANTKASAPTFPPGGPSSRNPGTPVDDLNIDAGSQDVCIEQRHVSLFGKFKRTEVNLGDLCVDDDGRLTVLGGKGDSKSVPGGAPLNNFANNRDWHDDVSDGPVYADIQFDGAEPVSCDPAWIIVAPPSYAPAINNVITLWDQALNVAVRMDPSLRSRLSPASFTRDIYPILKRTVFLQWVSRSAYAGHGRGTGGNFLDLSKLSMLSSSSAANRPVRQAVYDRLRRPGGDGRANMPQLKSGLDPNNPTSEVPPRLTDLQLELMDEWQTGQFSADWPDSPPVPPPFDEIPESEQPAALDKAALDACIGGPFYPGIEAGFMMARRDTYRAPFRIDNVKYSAGSITAGLACPWQADFEACGQLWWPAQRPNSVIRNGARTDWVPRDWFMVDMVANWSKLGFILADGNEFVEKKC